MVRLHRLLWIVVAGSMAMGGGYHRCYEYKADDFTLTPPQPFERMVLVVPKDWRGPETHPMVLLLTDRSGRKERMSQWLICDHNTTRGRGRYRCGGECDGGEVFVGEDMSLNLDTQYKLSVDIPVGRDEEGKRAKLDLKKGIDSAQAHEVSCPLYTERLYNPERLGDKSGEPLLDVCYTRKTKTKGHAHYHGCFMTTSRCRTIHREHFGHYPDIDSAYAAFLRCVDSRPH